MYYKTEYRLPKSLLQKKTIDSEDDIQLIPNNLSSFSFTNQRINESGYLISSVTIDLAGNLISNPFLVSLAPLKSASFTLSGCSNVL